jgi:Fe2+ transport system protein B
MIEITEHTRNVLLEVAKKKKIYVEGNILKLLKASKGDKEFEEYLNLCKEKDAASRKKRLSVTKQVQAQNKELAQAAKDNEQLLSDLQDALDEAKEAEKEAQKLKDEAVEDLDIMQKKSQFELIGMIVKIALFVICGVGIITTIMYGIALFSGHDTQIIGSTWSNMFGILLTNAFSIVGTIMGVKYASDKES